MKVRLYTNSWKTSVRAKITTVRSPGIESGRTIRQIAPTRLQPSTMADSSTSLGSDLKKPMRSQVQKGTVNVGYTMTSDHRLFWSPSVATSRENGMKSRVDGTR